MNAPFNETLADYIFSGHAYLHVPTTEKSRFLSQLKELVGSMPESGRQIYTWSHAVGWRDGEGNAASVQNGQPDAQKVCQEMLALPEESIFVLHEFGWYVQQKTYSYADIVIAWLCEIRDVLAATGRTVIFLGPVFDVPSALANDVTTVEFPLPDDAALETSVRFIMEDRALDQDVVPTIVSACRGMTQQQVEDRVALALRKFKSLNNDAAKLILREKAEILRRSGLLKYTEPPEDGLGLIGGNDAVKQHIRRDKACFTLEAKRFGIDPPRGIMLTGISGCGKTAISLAAAAELGVPLLQFDVGAMMSKWVGESESNVRSALRQVEAIGAVCAAARRGGKGLWLGWIGWRQWRRAAHVRDAAQVDVRTQLPRVPGHDQQRRDAAAARVHAQGTHRRDVRRVSAHGGRACGDLRDSPAQTAP